MTSKLNLELDAFSEEIFDLKGWVNRILEKKPKEESVEVKKIDFEKAKLNLNVLNNKKKQYLATVVLRLQLRSTELSSSLEETSTSALVSVPR